MKRLFGSLPAVFALMLLTGSNLPALDAAPGAPAGEAAKPTVLATEKLELLEKAVGAWVKETDPSVEVGWMRQTKGVLSFHTRAEGKPGDVPALSLTGYYLGGLTKSLAKLPHPGVPFALDLSSTEADDATFKAMAALTSLQFLDLSNTDGTGAGLKDLAACKSLQSLDLSDCSNVTDAGVKQLAALTSLQFLDLSNTDVTGAGLKELAACKSLQWLDLSDTDMTDAGVLELAALTSLQSLNLRLTRVTGAGLKALAACKSLQSLDLSQNELKWVFELAGIASLRSVDLSYSDVTFRQEDDLYVDFLTLHGVSLDITRTK